MKYIKLAAGYVSAGLICLMLNGCAVSPDTTARPPASAAEEGDATKARVFNYGTTAYGPEMGNAGLNPHDNYSGWSAIRYGVGETLFRFNEAMEIRPWLAAGYEQIDDYTMKIELRDDVVFSSGRVMDGQAVKECFDHLLAVHDRAPVDLKIREITADGYSITIVTEDKTPALLHFLSDPYGVVMDMSYGKDGVADDRNIAGTGPFIAFEVSDDHIYLRKNDHYWGGQVKTDQINVYAITDGDTMTMALQSGQIDAAQGLPYASIPLFEQNPDFKISSADTSRVFFGAMNLSSPVLEDIRVRQAICMGIDKAGFTSVLLGGNGTPAAGVFPANFTFGSDQVTAPEFNPEEAKALLADAGYMDTDGDGYADKNGEKLTIRWLTYPGRQELPLLAEAAQASLKEIGIDVQVNSTPNHFEEVSGSDWDIYVSALVTAPTGDPEYFFSAHCLADSAKNRGGYYNEKLEQLAQHLKTEFDGQKRSELAVEMQQLLLDDHAYLFASHLRMSFVMKANIDGLTAHPSDYYEITKDLEVN